MDSRGDDRQDAPMFTRTALLSLLFAVGCSSHGQEAPFAADSPWPKFRHDAAQTGRSSTRPTSTRGQFWSYRTGKGIFSSPVVAGDGTVYIGSADRSFYALHQDGSVAWKLGTGEIIDSAALLDDKGRVYFGSGDGNLRALDAKSGTLAWMTPADAGGVNGSYINWFEGNVQLSPSGQLYAPNDDFFLYQIDRDSGAFTQKLRLPDQTWSSPAFAKNGQLFIGNNNLVEALGSNLFSFDQASVEKWEDYVGVGSVAASPLATPGGLVVVGSFDGYVRAYDAVSGLQRWEFGARDHIYASPARLSDGTIVQAATDGSVYGLDETTGALRWTFDSRDPIRSSPAVDGDDNVYFGSGDGRLYVLDKAGLLRWSVQLIDEDRNDVNSSPALGKDAIYVGGESGELFSVPYDYCLRAEGKAQPRCAAPAALALPDDGGTLLLTTSFGAQLATPPAGLDPNQPIVLSLVARQGGHDTLALLDPATVTATIDPPAQFSVDVAGNGKFLTITPTAPLTAAADGTVTIAVSAGYLVAPDRAGLKLSGGTPGGNVSFSMQPTLNPPQATPLPLAPGTTWQVARIALPLPTLLPSYNQIGFDSLQYLVSIVESDGSGHAIAWMAGAKLDAGNATVIDPATQALFPLQVQSDGTFLTMINQAGVSVKVTNIVIPFQSFRMSAALGADGNGSGPVRMTGTTICADIATYGSFLQQLGLCNPTTDLLSVVGAANFTIYAAPPIDPASVGTATFAGSATSVTATLSGTQLVAAQHVASLLLVDATTGAPISLDYGLTTKVVADGAGLISTVTVPLAGHTLPASVRVHLMIDTASVATGTL
jgi:outer membrane protein assembly factor BamB